MLLFDAAHLVSVGAAGGMPRVPEFARAAHGTIGAAADPDLRLRSRVRLRGGVVERPVATLEVLFAVPERAHQPNRLVGAAATAFELDAHEVELVPVPAHAGA